MRDAGGYGSIGACRVLVVICRVAVCRVCAGRVRVCACSAACTLQRESMCRLCRAVTHTVRIIKKLLVRARSCCAITLYVDLGP